MIHMSKSSLVELAGGIMVVFALCWAFTLLERGADDEVKVQLTQLAEAEKGDILLFTDNRVCVLTLKPFEEIIAYTCQPDGPVQVAAATFVIQEVEAVVGPESVHFGPLNKAFLTTGHADY